MLQFLNSDFQQFTQLEKQEKQDENGDTEVPSNSQRQLRVKSFEEKPSNKPLNLIFQMLLQKKTQKRQQIKIDPKSIPLTINLTVQVQELPIIRKVMEKNEWKKANNFDGDILWCGPDNVQQAKQFTYDFAMVFLNQCISRIPGAKLISTKKETTSIMAKMRDYFPSVYNFYPKTYTLPEDMHVFAEDFEKNEGISYIAKPDKGTQGQGIFIVSQMEDLFTNGVKDMQFIKKNYIIQEYISNPLLLDDKKFDFRLYVLITSVKPLIAYINEEGLARLCTENYQDLNQTNLSNVFMHLTNYSLNKNSQNFITHPPDFQKINQGTKRTYTSAKKTLMKMGIDVPKLKLRIEQTIVRFLYGIAPFLLNSTREIYQDKWEKANCFHVIGFDILIDKDLKPWIIEINANPSLEITQVSFMSNGVKKVETSTLDAYVKMKVLEDAFIIAVKSPQDQIEQIGKGKYCNSYKMIIDGQPPIENLDLFYKLVDLYSNLCGLRYGNLNQMRFCRLANNSQLINDLLIKSDYDLIYKRIQLKSLQPDLSFWSFIEAIEQVGEKVKFKFKTLALEAESVKLHTTKSSHLCCYNCLETVIEAEYCQKVISNINYTQFFVQQLMFYVVQGLKTTLSIEPNYLDQLKDSKFILEQIVQKLEGKYFDEVGYIICINKCMNLNPNSDEQLDALIEEDGTVKLVIKFEAIVFQLKDMDIVDVEVTRCEAQAVSAKLGPIDVVIPRDRLPQNLQYSNESFKDDDEEVIKIGTKLRVQVVKANYKHGKLRAFAHLTGDGINNVCGIISDDLKL